VNAFRFVWLASIRGATKKREAVQSESPRFDPDLETLEKSYIYYTLYQTGWNKSKAAKILGIDLSTLYRKIDFIQHWNQLEIIFKSEIYIGQSLCFHTL